MEDWRLCGQEKYLKGVALYKIKLPEYWNESYEKKNDFYQKVLRSAKSQVEGLPDKEMYLEGDKIQMLWHEHCDFCWEKATTEIDAVFYCTQDYYHWICKQCFEEFKDQFGWTVDTHTHAFSVDEAVDKVVGLF